MSVRERGREIDTEGWTESADRQRDQEKESPKVLLPHRALTRIVARAKVTADWLWVKINRAGCSNREAMCNCITCKCNIHVCPFFLTIFSLTHFFIMVFLV